MYKAARRSLVRLIATTRTREEATARRSQKGTEMHRGKIGRFLEGVDRRERAMFEMLLGRRKASRRLKRLAVEAMRRNRPDDKRIDRVLDAIGRAGEVCGEQAMIRRLVTWTLELDSEQPRR